MTRTESDVLERVGLIRLDADLQVGLGVPEGGLCVWRVGMESVERGERRGRRVDPPGRGTAESNNSNFRDVRGWRDDRRRARTRRPFFVGDLQVRVLRGSAGNGVCEAVERGAGRGRGGGSVRSARRQFSMGGARETPTSSSRSRSRGGDAPHVPHATANNARAAIVLRGEAVEARVVISTPRTREVVARDAPRSARCVRANNGGARELKKTRRTETHQGG